MMMNSEKESGRASLQSNPSFHRTFECSSYPWPTRTSGFVVPRLLDPLCCLKQLVATAKNYISGRVCLSIGTFGRPVHLSVLVLAFFFLFSDTSSLIQSPVSAQDHNQNKNTLEQEITAVLVFQVVDLSEVASPSGCRNRSFSAGSHFSDDPSDSWNKEHYQIARPLNAIAFLPWTLRRSSGVSLASSRPTKRRI